MTTPAPPLATIRKEDGKYVLYTKDGSRKLGTYDTREDAEKRERQIEYFKRALVWATARGIDPYASGVGEPWGGRDDYADDDDADDDDDAATEE